MQHAQGSAQDPCGERVWSGTRNRDEWMQVEAKNRSAAGDRHVTWERGHVEATGAWRGKASAMPAGDPLLGVRDVTTRRTGVTAPLRDERGIATERKG
jgi:hypothetical protein